jgi:lipoprotein-releasing system ATP-binding protein
VNLELEQGASASIVGPSGSGKSTLLYILGTLDSPTSGTVTFDGENPFALDEKKLAAFRNRHIGFVFQDHCLMPQCSVLENVLIPTVVAGRKEDYASRARELLGRVGLAGRLDHLPAELSGGEKQRVALARALICSPRLLLCDEPTGSLDRVAAESVVELLLELHRERATTLVVVTHNLDLAARLAAAYSLEDRVLRRRG